MSNYGPPDSRYPGSDPWPGRGPHESAGRERNEAGYDRNEAGYDRDQATSYDRDQATGYDRDEAGYDRGAAGYGSVRRYEPGAPPAGPTGYGSDRPGEAMGFPDPNRYQPGYETTDAPRYPASGYETTDVPQYPRSGRGAASGYGSAQRYEPGRPASLPDWASAASEPTPPKSRAPVVILVTVLALLVIGGAGYYFIGRHNGGGTVAASGSASAAPIETSAPASDANPSTPAPESSNDARFVKAGQCVRNEGATGDKPRLTITTCAPKTYEVLRRFDGATNGKSDALTKCSNVTGYTDWYFFNSELDTLDFVLCLKTR